MGCALGFAVFVQVLVQAASSTTFVYEGSAASVPASVKFQVGDKLTLTVEQRELHRKLVGRSVRVAGRIKFYTRTVVDRKKRSCGPFGLFTCYDEIHRKEFDELEVTNVTSSDYTPFLQVGPALHLVTPPGEKVLALLGEDGAARQALTSGGYTYVALRQGELQGGALVLPPGSFGLGSEDSTPAEREVARAWVGSRCAGRTECTVVGEPVVTVTRGSVKLQLNVSIDRQGVAP